MGTTIKAIVSMAAVSVMAWGGTSAKAQVSEQEPFKIRYTVGVGTTPEWRIKERWGENPFFPTFGVSFEAQLSTAVSRSAFMTAPAAIPRTNISVSPKHHLLQHRVNMI